MENKREPEIPCNIDGEMIKTSTIPLMKAIVDQLTTAWNYAHMLHRYMPIAPQVLTIEKAQKDWRAICAYAMYKKEKEDAEFTPKAWVMDHGEFRPATETELPELIGNALNEDWETEPDPTPENPDPLADPMTIAKWPKEQDPDYWTKQHQ